MIAEKASDMIREKDTIKPIKEYFKHLIAVKHKKFEEEIDEEEARTHGFSEAHHHHYHDTAAQTQQHMQMGRKPMMKKNVKMNVNRRV